VNQKIGFTLLLLCKACELHACFCLSLTLHLSSFLLYQLIGKLDENWNAVGHQPYPAMYSSIFGGVVLNPAMMMIPIDDHIVHRGHGVFDTTILFNG